MFHVGSSHVGFKLPISFSVLTRLQHLDLSKLPFSGTRIRASLPAAYSTLTGLQQLYLSNNHLTGSLPAAYSALTGLQQLYLSNNYLTGSLPAAYSALTGLQQLQLNSDNEEFNSLTGSLPAAYSVLTGLSTLDLSRNRLTGSLPAAYSALIWLRYPAYTVLSGMDLFLDHNYITGLRNLPSLLLLMTCCTQDLSRYLQFYDITSILIMIKHGSPLCPHCPLDGGDCRGVLGNLWI